MTFADDVQDVKVSTHSRPKAAAKMERLVRAVKVVSTHSRPKAAARKRKKAWNRKGVSTHSRPKAAAQLE